MNETLQNKNDDDKKLLQTGLTFDLQRNTIFLSDQKHEAFLSRLSRDQQN